MSANTNWLLAEFIERSDEPSMSRGIGAAAAAASKRRGLVVGVNEYRSLTIRNLRGAEPDAAAYFQTLVSRGGFDPADLAALNGERSARRRRSEHAWRSTAVTLVVRTRGGS